MTSYEERGWREHSAEAGCRAAEDLVEGKRTALGGYQALGAIGLMVVSLSASGVFGESVLLRLVLTLLGGVAVGFGFDMAGRVRGQRQIVQVWRKCLKRSIPTDDPTA